MNKHGHQAIIGIVIVLALSGCADSMTFEQAESASTVGFLYGYWHGLILFFSWFISLFTDDVAIYAIYNNGGWYDFGYMLGAGSSVGGSSLATGKRKSLRRL